MRERSLLIFAVESTGVWQAAFRESDGALEPLTLPYDRWDCAPYCDDPSGLRLGEELIRRVKELFESLESKTDLVGITLPGTLTGTSKLERSTRLGVHQPLDLAGLFLERGMPACHLLHDTECMALGEARYGALCDVEGVEQGHEEFAFVYADEGVGASLFFDGWPFRGAGCAGRIGRLVVVPEGPYNSTFRSRGPLETFAARPWVSTASTDC
jgi:predicted NBD/HSP70 family sugar kinase